MYNPQEPCPVCLEVTGCDCQSKPRKKKDKRQRPGSDFFQADWNDEVYVRRKLSKQGRIGAKKLG